MLGCRLSTAVWLFHYFVTLFRLLHLGRISLVTPEDCFGLLSQRKTKSFLHSNHLLHLHFQQLCKFYKYNERFVYKQGILPLLLLFFFLQFHACPGVSIPTSTNRLIHFSGARQGSKAQPICSDIKRCLDVRDVRARENETEVKRWCEKDWHVIWRVFGDLLLPAALIEWRRLIWRAEAPLGFSVLTALLHRPLPSLTTDSVLSSVIQHLSIPPFRSNQICPLKSHNKRSSKRPQSLH